MEIHRTVHAYLEWIFTCQLNFWCLLIFEKKKSLLDLLFSPRRSKSTSDVHVDPAVIRQVRYEELQKYREKVKQSEDKWQDVSTMCTDIWGYLSAAHSSCYMIQDMPAWAERSLVAVQMRRKMSHTDLWDPYVLLGEQGSRCFGVLDSCRVEKRTVWIEIVGVQMLTRAALPSGYGPASLKIVARITTCTKKVEIMWNEGMM